MTTDELLKVVNEAWYQKDIIRAYHNGQIAVQDGEVIDWRQVDKAIKDRYSQQWTQAGLAKIRRRASQLADKDAENDEVEHL